MKLYHKVATSYLHNTVLTFLLECVVDNCDICDSNDLCTKCKDGYVSSDQGGCNKSTNYSYRQPYYTNAISV